MKLASVFCSLLLLATSLPACGQRTQVQQGRRAYDFPGSVTSSGVPRKFQVHIPPGYDRTKPIPVVMVFHGLGMDGTMMRLMGNFQHESDRMNFVVVYPDALGRRWDDANNAHNDLQFVADMLGKLATIVNIDRRHIYAAGISNGGYFTQYLACATSIVSAIGVVASTMAQSMAQRCQNEQRVPAIFFVGTQDPLVPSNDPDHNINLGKLGDAVGLSGLGTLSAPMARMGGMMTVEETVEFWCHHNQASPSPYTTQLPDTDPHDGTKVIRETYGSYGNEVVYYKIVGGGHTWPGAIYSGPSDIMGNETHDIDATELISEFFMKH
jgi:polyhydroxybutyrate depolymerase